MYHLGHKRGTQTFIGRNANIDHCVIFPFCCFSDTQFQPKSTENLGITVFKFIKKLHLIINKYISFCLLRFIYKTLDLIGNNPFRSAVGVSQIFALLHGNCYTLLLLENMVLFQVFGGQNVLYSPPLRLVQIPDYPSHSLQSNSIQT